MSIGSLAKKAGLGLLLIFGAPAVVAGGLKLAEMYLANLDKKDQEAFKAAMASYDNAVEAYNRSDYRAARTHLENTRTLLKSLRMVQDKKTIDNFVNMLDCMVNAQEQIDKEKYREALDWIIKAKEYLKGIEFSDLTKYDNLYQKLRELERLVGEGIKEKKVEENMKKVSPLYKKALAAFKKNRFKIAMDFSYQALVIMKKSKVEDDTGLVKKFGDLATLCKLIQEKIIQGNYGTAMRWVEDGIRIVNSAGFPADDKDMILEKLLDFRSTIESAGARAEL
ncbi:hypothetical protein J4230_01125 [Candidatus Woesearchaeota archaeon]|nr:hypothetical protein [Candidatus Woesearchaeota archaeon]